MQLSPFEQVQQAVEFIQGQVSLAPQIGMVLGSGLNGVADRVQDPVAIPYAEIPHFPRSTVEGHAGRLVLGQLGGVRVAVMQGRVHLYEGYTPQQVVFPARVLGMLGIRQLVLTNAAAGLDLDWSPGTLVGIRDQINLTGVNAAMGPNEPRFARTPGAGLRFFDMSTAYDAAMLQLARDTAQQQGWNLPTGVYLAVPGPSFETPAEIRAFRTLGADLVGMSTVHETIVARHMGLRVLGLSLVTNAGAGLTAATIHHEEVMEVGRRAADRLGALLEALLGPVARLA